MVTKHDHHLDLGVTLKTVKRTPWIHCLGPSSLKHLLVSGQGDGWQSAASGQSFGTPCSVIDQLVPKALDQTRVSKFSERPLHMNRTPEQIQQQTGTTW